MADAQRLSSWGWFARAFAGGFGAMFGVMTAMTAACALGYALFAAGIVALASFGTVPFNTINMNTVAPPRLAEASQCFTPASPSQMYAVPPPPTGNPTASYPYYTAAGPADYLAEMPAQVGAGSTPVNASEEAPSETPATASVPAVDAEPAALRPAINPHGAG